QTAPSVAVTWGWRSHDFLADLGNNASRSMNNPATGKPFESARDVVARDIKKLRRVYPEIPNGQLLELIAMNKSMYIEIRVKRAG
ncbi:hypothetical protein, partial [Aeromonas enteropelogenes]|uniref:hypothetical protein n=1 Tax=Aeromonas enteropelogenes TaxID=29489 RepID=UPI003B9F63D9